MYESGARNRKLTIYLNPDIGAMVVSRRPVCHYFCVTQAKISSCLGMSTSRNAMCNVQNVHNFSRSRKKGLTGPGVFSNTKPPVGVDLLRREATPSKFAGSPSVCGTVRLVWLKFPPDYRSSSRAVRPRLSLGELEPGAQAALLLP